MSKITNIWAREILDSRGTPTVEAICQLDSKHVVSAAIPSGTSTGTHETIELRDNDSERYHGKGVLQAVKNVHKVLGPQIVGMDPTDQKGIDTKLRQIDGTENKSKYGGNSILAISSVVAKAGALISGKSLYSHFSSLATAEGIETRFKIPVPLFNMINGGLHGAGNLDFQEFFVIPSSSKTYREGLQMGVEIYMSIGENLARRGAIHSVGDEGGYAPNLFTNADAFELLVDSIKTTKYSLGRDVLLGLDVAANSFYKDGSYSVRDMTTPMNENALLEYYKNLNSKYKLAVLEDGFHEDAWESWKKLTASMGNQVTIVGDDLLVTNPKRVDRAIKEGACNGLLVKPNQIGTISETISVIKKARDAKWKVIVSHRSGETNDTLIADFAVGIGADYLKFGAPARGERVAKYNRLLAIDSELSLA